MVTEAEYIESAQSGTDGTNLSDYDLVGSASRATGLFALNQIDHFDLLYLPPPEISREIFVDCLVRSWANPLSSNIPLMM